MARGGRRPGSGRPKGSPNKNTQACRELLQVNRELILQKAIALATKKDPNIPILLKLVDKIVPTLHSSKIGADVHTDSPFEGVDNSTIASILLEYQKQSTSDNLDLGGNDEQ
jgi:hypothetical protein